MRITAIDGATATIASEGLVQRASVMLVPEARVGDYVLVHAGYAISVIDETEARETLSLLAEIESFGRAEGAAAGSSQPGTRDDDGG